jgi:serine/threonine-protein kinase
MIEAARASEASMQPGQMVSATIRLLSPLAQGTMGAVWVAEHLGLDAQVAVKFMSPAAAGDPTLLARFAREAQAIARIRSPHVVQIVEHGLAPDGAPYIAMELVAGASLQRCLDERGRLDLPEVNAIVAQACAGLGAAHRSGVVHRDIKPANIVLAEVSGATVVKLVDFGVAKDQPDPSEMTRSADKMGTPYYMSPEQLRSAKHVDGRADLWSLGVVAYYALTGALPFNARSFGDLVLTIHRGLFTRPTSLRPDLPPELDDWFSRILSRDPAQRFASAEEAAAAFDRAARG